uniref:Peptidase S9 prolyl oligopeptidase catalytic domain-containing protein n=1 Tax=Plectus sambesii TaxID=2011161 RepID=A0A914V1A6_9BILA
LTLLETIPPYWKPMFHSFVKRIGGDPTTPEGRKFLKERSPLTYAKQVSKPLLIAQGANDPRVKKSESDQFYEALKEKNISATYLIYPDEGHGFQRPQNQMSYTALAEKFLSECLGGRFEPITNEKEKSTVEIIEHKAE